LKPNQEITVQTLPPGKIRALQTTATPDGIFAILAIDHRDSLRVLLNPKNPGAIPAATLTNLKLDIIKHIAPLASAVMVDPVYSAAQAIVTAALPGSVGFLCAVEAQGYLHNPHVKENALLPGWSVAKAKRLGAGGIKLLVLYHPDAGEVTVRQEELVQAAITDCARTEIPLFLEPLIYPIDPGMSPKSIEFATQRRRLVVETARRLGALGPDILKLQFPLDATHHRDPALWLEACTELNEAAGRPWALLSGGDSFDTFKAQLQVACQAGCSGFMVGRALWGDAITSDAARRTEMLLSTVRSRFMELAEIAASFGKGWSTQYAPPDIDETWFRHY
jgi:tagatose-1,6-bisphosphate aldolase